MQEIGQPLEGQQPFPRPWHRHTRLNRPFLKGFRLEAAFKMNVDFRLGQSAQ
jgi:hypothetical protein